MEVGVPSKLITIIVASLSIKQNTLLLTVQCLFRSVGNIDLSLSSAVSQHRHHFPTMALLKSFVEVHPDSHFPIHNLPYGVFKPQPSSSPRPGVAIGDYVLDLSEIASAGLFDGPFLRNSDCFLQVTFSTSICLSLVPPTKAMFGLKFRKCLYVNFNAV